MQASPVAVFAEKNNIPCLKPEKLEEELEAIFTTSSQDDGPRKEIFQQENMRESKKDFQFDLLIVVAYGKIIPENILNMPKLGSINVHYSLLPKCRGASPIESAILHGDTETGITIQKMAFRIDSGPILAQEKVEIGNDEKAPDLCKRLTKIGAELLVKIMPDFIEGKIKAIPQDESQATYCKKIKKEDGLVNLKEELPGVLHNKFRAYATWPRIFFFQNGKRIIITDAELINNQFIIRKVLPESKKKISYEEFKRGLSTFF